MHQWLHSFEVLHWTEWLTTKTFIIVVHEAHTARMKMKETSGCSHNHIVGLKILMFDWLSSTSQRKVRQVTVKTGRRYSLFSFVSSSSNTCIKSFEYFQHATLHKWECAISLFWQCFLHLGFSEKFKLTSFEFGRYKLSKHIVWNAPKCTSFAWLCISGLQHSQFRMHVNVHQCNLSVTAAK